MIDKKRDIILVGDRVLIDPASDQDKTPTGLYLPPGVKEKERVQGGYIIKKGPGFPMPNPGEGDDEPWAQSTTEPKYLPLQAEEGDYAIFMRKSAIEIELENKKYLIVPHSTILVLIRDSFIDE